MKPGIRFGEFTDAWEQRKFKDNIVSIQTGTNLLGAEANSGVPLLKMGNIQRGYFSFNKLEYLDEKQDVEKENIAQYGDFLFNTRNTLELVGKGATWTGKSGEYAFNSNIARFTFDGINTIFFNYLYNTQQMIEQIQSRAVGSTSVAAVYPRDLDSVEYYLPNIEEQKQIGSFFLQLDNLITLHQRKLNKIKNFKSAYLSKMFPKEGERYPRLRFAGFTDAWEQRKWINTVDISTNMVDPRKSIYDNLPHIGPGNIESFTGRLLDNVNTVKEDNLISAKFHFNKGDVIYGKINPQLGKYVYAPCEGLASADAYVLNSKNGIHQTFLYAVLQTKHFFKYSVSVSMRSGMPKINRNELNEYSFMAPSEEEQEQIGKLFLNLDNLITLHQRELEKLKQFKEAMLQKMFV